jgi:predicted CoA-substrate-specific enzyme activase
LEEFYREVPESRVRGIRVTGSGGHFIANRLGTRFENEFKALARGVEFFYPDVRTVFEMGGETSKYLLLDSTNGSTDLGIVDYESNGECAAGTGSFLDQQASRLQYQVEEVGEVVCGATCAAHIAGRCSVFAKSDMVHAQQKGYQTDQILKGLCEAVARNFKSSIVKGKSVVPPVAFVGAVAQNHGVEEALRQVFGLQESHLRVPRLHAWLGALGAAILEWETPQPTQPRSFSVLRHFGKDGQPATTRPLSLQNVVLLRDRVQAAICPANGEATRAFMGIDVGSVSTNLAVLDEDGRVLKEIYLRTAGRPLEVVHQGLQEIESALGPRVDIVGVGTTGSGRELIGELVGADTVNDEITAHKTGAMFISTTMIGQDSKFISIDKGVVVDFTMNEACAAGTGSFLEEQAEQMGIQIKKEFSRLALSSRSPTRLGERCTVFMGRDVSTCMHNGSEKRDLAAGLAYSIALNYLNRVVRRRKIGDVIYFQGGTAYNDAVAAAFAQVLGKRIIVPPYNGVMGAIGEALLAREWAHRAGRPSRFRGYRLDHTQFRTREFVCKACSNYCEMKEFNVGGERTYWGDKCSDKFRKRAKTERQPVIEDLLAFRERALREGYNGPTGHGLKVGIPRAMYYYDRFPFWHRYLSELGFDVVVSGSTDRQIAAQGVELSVAEPCFPVQIAHGHVKALLAAGVDYVLLPNVMDMESPPREKTFHLCPWNQTLPYVLRAAPQLASGTEKFLLPTLNFRLGFRHTKKQLAQHFSRLGFTQRRSNAAAETAQATQAAFDKCLYEAGRRALAALEETGEPGILLVGRPYNLYDRNLNCDLPRKLRTLYGANVIPLDFLPLDELVNDVNGNMYWYSGRRILAAGRLVRRCPSLHLVYVTNFKCGPDSFIKYFLREASGGPFLALQFDGHGNDAGYMTRCEAYLQSKGILQC